MPACRQVPRRVPAPPWLRALLVVVQVTPLMLFAASSSLGARFVELLVERPAPATLGALGLLYIAVSSMLVYATVIDPLCRRVQTQKFLPPQIGIKKETDNEWLFRMWLRRKFAACQTVLLIVIGFSPECRGVLPHPAFCSDWRHRRRAACRHAARCRGACRRRRG